MARPSKEERRRAIDAALHVARTHDPPPLEVEVGDIDPECAWCGAKADPDAVVIVMMAGPNGERLCITCGKEWEDQRDRAKRQ